MASSSGVDGPGWIRLPPGDTQQGPAERDARGRGVNGATTSEGTELCVFLTGGERAVGRYSFAVERNDPKNGVAGGRN